jgi:hypothetical protein
MSRISEVMLWIILAILLLYLWGKNRATPITAEETMMPEYWDPVLGTASQESLDKLATAIHGGITPVTPTYINESPTQTPHVAMIVPVIGRTPSQQKLFEAAAARCRQYPTFPGC